MIGPASTDGTLARWFEVLTLSGGYNTNVVLFGVALLGLAAGAVGSFAMLKKQSLVADAFAHASLVGVAVAFLVQAWFHSWSGSPEAALAGAARPGPERNMVVLLVGAGIAGAAAVAAIEFLVRKTRLRADTATAAVSSASFGAGIATLSIARRVSGADQAGLDSLIFGAASSMTRADAYAMAALALIAALFTAVLFKPLRAVAFNDRFARTSGLPVNAIDIALGALVAAVTLAGMQAVGMLLVVALLITPCATARLWTRAVGPLVATSAALGATCGVLGVSLSRVLPSVPTGAVVVLIAAAAFVVSALFAPERGLLAGLRRERRMRAAVLVALRAPGDPGVNSGGAER
ncbi:Manganese transport system membrane protein MntB [Planctomycetes bacterium Poly30]|uniref:Manganese transport system membrane protein MntB n=1 Tax=Saltatorellus ferox TaxID=2528018 RepID=A0A518ELF7_9BACT|nr:Manganese transport system membrane protein MntB [Planctomycetes bacterium Poly30]